MPYKKYRVMIREEITYHVDVHATDQDHAEAVALAEFGMGGGLDADNSEPWIVSTIALKEQP